MASIESPELKSLDSHAQKLTTSLSTDPVCVAGALVSKKLIQDEVLLEMFRVDTRTGKATVLFKAVRKEIEVAPKRLAQFLEILSEQTCTKEVVESIRSTYQGEFSECI